MEQRYTLLLHSKASAGTTQSHSLSRNQEAVTDLRSTVRSAPFLTDWKLRRRQMRYLLCAVIPRVDLSAKRSDPVTGFSSFDSVRRPKVRNLHRAPVPFSMDPSAVPLEEDLELEVLSADFRYV